MPKHHLKHFICSFTVDMMENVVLNKITRDCQEYGLQYVGETVQQLNARFTGYRAGIKNPEKNGTCKILSNHFNKGICKGS